MRRCSVLFVAAEAAPFASVGGLSQVLYFLPRALKKRGHDVRVFMPKYGSIDERKYRIKSYLTDLKIPTGEKGTKREIICNVKLRPASRYDPAVYFLENTEYYETRANVYGYSDDHIRFGLLSRGVLEFLRRSDFSPDIIHCNDWHTGYMIDYLRAFYRRDRAFKQTATVFTIHNLRNQGMYDFRNAPPLSFDDGKSSPAPMMSSQFKKQNPIKRAIIYSDLINTVSETYSREILTDEYGEGLHDLLRQVRAKIFGVLNGLDYSDYDPTTDAVIYKNFSSTRLYGRAENKTDLQKEFNLDVSPDTPLIALVGRLDAQKGLNLVEQILPHLLDEHGVQLVVMGAGVWQYHQFFRRLEEQYPRQVGTHLMQDWNLPRKIFAGCDIFLLPSKFEPGGIVVLEAMRYGAIPVVRATGGLADTVTDFGFLKTDGDTQQTAVGTGFVFDSFNQLGLYGAVVRALELYKNKQLWQSMVKRCMRADFSWDQSARSYQKLYLRAIDFHRQRTGTGLSKVRQVVSG